MRKLLLSALLCLLAATVAQADPFVILPNGELAFNTSFTTQGVFTCTPLCTGSGTNSVVFGSGMNTVSITFTGVNTTILVGAAAVPTVVGQIQVVTTGAGFIFPVGNNPNARFIFFNIMVTQSSPTAATGALLFSAPGGGPSLPFTTLFTDHIEFPIGANPPPFTYTHIVYSFSPFTIPNTNGTVNVTANVSAVPEPAGLLLFGSGMILTLLRKRFSRTAP